MPPTTLQKVPKSQATAPADEHVATIVTQGAESLLSQAVAAGAGIDTLERLMALRKEMLAEADTVVICAGQTPRRGVSGHLIGGAKEATELDAKRAMLEGAELASRL